MKAKAHRPLRGADLRGAAVILALGSGAARGWAHVGVIRALLEAGVRIRAIAGTSMGALVGGVHAAGRIEALAGVASSLDWRRMLYLFWDAPLPRSGLVDGHKLLQFVRQFVDFPRIESLPIPFRAVAADVATGEEMVLADGDVLDAIRASISIPGMFTPAPRGERFLVDGGIVNPLPVSVARTLGPEPVIAVDVSYFEAGATARPFAPLPPEPAAEPSRLSREVARITERVEAELRARWPDRLPSPWTPKKKSPPAIFDVIGNSIRIMETRITAARLSVEPPDLLLRPPLSGVGFMDFHHAADIIRLGYTAAREALGGPE